MFDGSGRTGLDIFDKGQWTDRTVLMPTDRHACVFEEEWTDFKMENRQVEKLEDLGHSSSLSVLIYHHLSSIIL